MEVGDRYDFVPSAFTGERDEAQEGRKMKEQTVRGRIVYIHPMRRYFTVQAVVSGQVIRESFTIIKR